jgi:Xylose isomerase-like TIM barrel
MKRIGFSTGALAAGDFHRALEMLSGKNVNAVELSALRQDELAPLVQQLDKLDLTRFKYISFHDAMHTPSAWACLGDCLCIENMDKRKPIGQTATDLAKFFDALPNASLCFDIGHARQIDPTMSEAWAILQHFRNRIKQLHVSEVNTQSKHDPISLESILAFQKVSHLLPADVPIILESRVEESEINEEIETALNALSPATQLAIRQ